MYKRPTLRAHGCYSAPRAIPLNSSSWLSELVHRADPPRPPPKAWVPPMYAESYFMALKSRGVDTAAYEQMTADFYEKYPRKVWTTGGVVEQTLDFSHMEPIFQKYFSRGKTPPVPEYIAALAKCGYSGDALAKVERYFKHIKDTSAERQERLDLVFARWPSANKAAPKKVIKAVKKKMR